MSLLASEARAQRRKRGEEVGVWEEGGEMQGRKKDERKKEGGSESVGGKERGEGGGKEGMTNKLGERGRSSERYRSNSGIGGGGGSEAKTILSCKVEK